ncbi:VWA domain-containing protein [uncultured Bacteroides sp.]|uniref:VWA domain-containing protein n=1 Tax=uncultured Bacteroides sp. TaxID=162156 RepID=UPI002614F5BA|nr:VWA domain-containing protein [uncultured Bacteroides sp.]
MKELKAIYLDELRRRCSQHLFAALQDRTILPGELEEVVWDYYRQTTPSLQEFYSRYTPEWEVFYEHESMLPSDFLDFLYCMQSAFRKRYSLVELDISYYIEQMERCSSDLERRKQIQNLFLDKWFHLLTSKEYDYQFHHIEELCDGFFLFDKNLGLKTSSGVHGTRIKWLLLNHPELYRKIVPYEKCMEKNRQIQELVRVLGKHSIGENKRFDTLSGVRMEELVRSAVPSDIEGISLGDDLNHLLPIEYCYLSDNELFPAFAQRYAEKRLQVFDSRSQKDTASVRLDKKRVAGQGPFIVCIDTSGSMQGRKEVLAKSALLAIARLTEKTHRKCYVINFAEDIRVLLVKDLKQDMPMLVDFLNQRFDGGTNIGPAIDEAVRMAKSNGWLRSDIVMISDFEMPPATDELINQVQSLKKRETSFYALVFGSRPEMDYLNMCDRIWDMEIP